MWNKAITCMAPPPPPAWLHLLRGSTSCMAPPPAWLHLLHGSTSYMTPPPAWLHLLHGSTSCMAPPSAWLLETLKSSVMTCSIFIPQCIVIGAVDAIQWRVRRRRVQQLWPYGILRLVSIPLLESLTLRNSRSVCNTGTRAGSVRPRVDVCWISCEPLKIKPSFFGCLLAHMSSSWWHWLFDDM